MYITQYQFGNVIIITTVKLGSLWEQGEQKRQYYIVSSSKSKGITVFYELHGGTTKDNVVTTDGRTFCYGHSYADSKVKRRALESAALALAKKVVSCNSILV